MALVDILNLGVQIKVSVEDKQLKQAATQLNKALTGVAASLESLSQKSFNLEAPAAALGAFNESVDLLRSSILSLQRSIRRNVEIINQSFAGIADTAAKVSQKFVASINRMKKAIKELQQMVAKKLKVAFDVIPPAMPKVKGPQIAAANIPNVFQRLKGDVTSLTKDLKAFGKTFGTISPSNLEQASLRFSDIKKKLVDTSQLFERLRAAKVSPEDLRKMGIDLESIGKNLSFAKGQVTQIERALLTAKGAQKIRSEFDVLRARAEDLGNQIKRATKPTEVKRLRAELAGVKESFRAARAELEKIAVASKKFGAVSIVDKEKLQADISNLQVRARSLGKVIGSSLGIATKKAKELDVQLQAMKGLEPLSKEVQSIAQRFSVLESKIKSATSPQHVAALRAELSGLQTALQNVSDGAAKVIGSVQSLRGEPARLVRAEFERLNIQTTQLSQNVKQLMEQSIAKESQLAAQALIDNVSNSLTSLKAQFEGLRLSVNRVRKGIREAATPEEFSALAQQANVLKKQIDNVNIKLRELKVQAKTLPKEAAASLTADIDKLRVKTQEATLSLQQMSQVQALASSLEKLGQKSFQLEALANHLARLREEGQVLPHRQMVKFNALLSSVHDNIASFGKSLKKLPKDFAGLKTLEKGFTDIKKRVAATTGKMQELGIIAKESGEKGIGAFFGFRKNLLGVLAASGVILGAIAAIRRAGEALIATLKEAVNVGREFESQLIVVARKSLFATEAIQLFVAGHDELNKTLVASNRFFERFGITQSRIAALSQELGTSFEETRRIILSQAKALAGLQNQLLEINKRFPQTVRELGRVAVVGRTLGFELEQLPGFVELVAQAQLATAEDAEKLALGMGRLASVLGLRTLPVTKEFRETLKALGKEGITPTTVELTKLMGAIINVSDMVAAFPGELIEIAQRAGFMAKQFGVSNDFLIAFSALARDAGISAAEAGTNLGKLIRRIEVRADRFARALNMPLADFLQQLQQAKQQRRFGEFMVSLINNLRETTENMQKSGVAAKSFESVLASIIGEREGITKVFFAIANNMERLPKLLKAAGKELNKRTEDVVRGNTRLAREVNRAMQQFSNVLRRISSNLENIRQNMFQILAVPIREFILEPFLKLLDIIQKLPDETKRTIVQFTTLAGVVLSVLGVFLGFGVVVESLRALELTLGKILLSGLSIVTSPIFVLLILFATSFLGIVIALREEFGNFTNILNRFSSSAAGIFSSLQSFAIAIKDAFVSGFKSISDEIIRFLRLTREAFTLDVSPLDTSLQSIAQNSKTINDALMGVRDGLSGVVAFVAPLAGAARIFAVIGGVVEFLGSIIFTIGSAISAIISGIREAAQELFTFFSGIAKAIFGVGESTSSAGGFIAGLIGDISEFFGLAFKLISNILELLARVGFPAIKGIAAGLVDLLGPIFFLGALLLKVVVKAINFVLRLLISMVEFANEKLRGEFGKALASISFWIARIAVNIVGLVEGPLALLGKILGRISDAVIFVFQKLKFIGEAVKLETLAQKLSAIASVITEMITKIPILGPLIKFLANVLKFVVDTIGKIPGVSKAFNFLIEQISRFIKFLDKVGFFNVASRVISGVVSLAKTVFGITNALQKETSKAAKASVEAVKDLKIRLDEAVSSLSKFNKGFNDTLKLLKEQRRSGVDSVILKQLETISGASDNLLAFVDIVKKLDDERVLSGAIDLTQIFGELINQLKESSGLLLDFEKFAPDDEDFKKFNKTFSFLASNIMKQIKLLSKEAEKGKLQAVDNRIMMLVDDISVLQEQFESLRRKRVVKFGDTAGIVLKLTAGKIKELDRNIRAVERSWKSLNDTIKGTKEAQKKGDPLQVASSLKMLVDSVNQTLLNSLKLIRGKSFREFNAEQIGKIAEQMSLVSKKIVSFRKSLLTTVELFGDFVDKKEISKTISLFVQLENEIFSISQLLKKSKNLSAEQRLELGKTLNVMLNNFRQTQKFLVSMKEGLKLIDNFNKLNIRNTEDFIRQRETIVKLFSDFLKSGQEAGRLQETFLVLTKVFQFLMKESGVFSERSELLKSVFNEIVNRTFSANANIKKFNEELKKSDFSNLNKNLHGLIFFFEKLISLLKALNVKEFKKLDVGNETIKNIHKNVQLVNETIIRLKKEIKDALKTIEESPGRAAMKPEVMNFIKMLETMLNDINNLEEKLRQTEKIIGKNIGSISSSVINFMNSTTRNLMLAVESVNRLKSVNFGVKFSGIPTERRVDVKPTAAPQLASVTLPAAVPLRAQESKVNINLDSSALASEIGEEVGKRVEKVTSGGNIRIEVPVILDGRKIAEIIEEVQLRDKFRSSGMFSNPRNDFA